MLGTGGARVEDGDKIERPAKSQRAKPTLRTIADLSGMAVPTVSRALNDAPDIGSATKLKIREIAQQIGYVPNRAGVRLRTGRTNVIALLLPNVNDLTSHASMLISSIASGLEGTPFHLNVTPFFASGDSMEPVRYLVENGSADAVILNLVMPDDPRVAYLLERGVPFVTHGRTTWAASHAHYDFDNMALGRIAVEKLVQNGRSHLMLITPPPQYAYAQQLIDGVAQAAVRKNVRVIRYGRATCFLGYQDLMALVRKTLDEDPTIDGIICPSTSGAMAAIAALEQTGRTLGDDIDLFTKETVPILDWFRPNVLTVVEDTKKAGAFLARAAIHAVNAPDDPPMQFVEAPIASTS